MIIRVDSLPTDVEPVSAEHGKIVVAHSETLHDHVMEATHVQAFKEKGSVDAREVFKMFLRVDNPTEITHLRSFDTHAPLLVEKGNYVIRRQREHTPEGWRKAAD